MSGHLGERGAALVDDQLDRDARDRALAHLAGCPRCQREIDVQRRMKARLDSMGDPGIPAGLLSRLQSMSPPADPPGPSPVEQLPVEQLSVERLSLEQLSVERLSVEQTTLPPARRPAPAAPPACAPAAVSRPAPATNPFSVLGGSVLAGGTLLGAAHGASRTRRVLLGAASVLLVGGGAAVVAVAAAQPASDPSRPAVDAFEVQHGTTGSGVPLHDPAVTAVTTGWTR